ncbi:hypothetical protein KFE25_013302 [Diacronema lutheri]|uniref:HhH-GPD domain-containing protein n=2 Tax=Diacronema lutheri TaxID=2081491 RepID=A0A8J6CD42_DIALT|nr:hypothetical protein KFE25_013302 [Diacronema lutheri]
MSEDDRDRDVYSRFFQHGADRAARLDEPPLERALKALACNVARKGEYEAQAGATAAVLDAAERSSDEARRAFAVEAVSAELARVLVNVGSAAKRAPRARDARDAARLAAARAELNTLRARARRLAARLGLSAHAAGAPRSLTPESAHTDTALAPARSMAELRGRCPIYARTRSARHVCEQLCYFREFAPQRMRREFADAALRSAPGGATLATDVWQWRAELALRPSPKGATARGAFGRGAACRQRWRVLLRPPARANGAMQPGYESVAAALRALGLGNRNFERASPSSSRAQVGGDNAASSPAAVTSVACELMPPAFQCALHRAGKKRGRSTPSPLSERAPALLDHAALPSSSVRLRVRALFAAGGASCTCSEQPNLAGGGASCTCSEQPTLAGGGAQPIWGDGPRAGTPCRPTRSRTPPPSPYGLIEELMADEPFQLLVCCILLNQTRRSQVDRVLPRLLARFGSARKMAGADEAELVALLRPLGLHRRRAKSLIAFAAHFARGAWQRPSELPGVGKYAQDAYDVFCLGRWDDVAPDDHALSYYCAWVRGLDPDPHAPAPAEPRTEPK